MTTRTFKAAAAALATAVALPAMSTVANAEPTDPSLLADVSAYLVGELDETHLVPSQWGPDYGLSIDVVLALASTGADADQVAATTAALAEPANVEAYTTFGSETERYAGSFAKLTVGLLAGGTASDDPLIGDLLAELRELTTETGRVSDVSDYGDYSSVITQSFVVLAFTAAGEPLPDGVVDFLVADQCETGGFTNTFGDAPDCTGDPDATSFAVQALLAAEATGADVADTLEAAADHLTATQVDGVWLSDDRGDGPVANANSTGLAAQAFSALGRETDQARAFLASLQDPDTCGLRYQESDADGDARATAQAVPALAEADLFALATGSHTPAALGATVCAGEDGGTDDGTSDGGSDDGTTDGGSDDGTGDGGSDDGTGDGGSDDGTDGATDGATDADGSDDGAGVDDDGTDEAPAVEDRELTRDGTVEAVTVADATADDTPERLARTGGDRIPAMLAAALAALAAGIAMTLVDRRRRGVV